LLILNLSEILSEIISDVLSGLFAGYFCNFASTEKSDDFEFNLKRMEIIRKTNILIKTERKFVIRQSSAEEEIWCETCDGQMITAQNAAVLHGISTREIYGLVEKGTLHFVESGAKILYVCPSLIYPANLPD